MEDPSFLQDLISILGIVYIHVNEKYIGSSGHFWGIFGFWIFMYIYISYVHIQKYYMYIYIASYGISIKVSQKKSWRSIPSQKWKLLPKMEVMLIPCVVFVGGPFTTFRRSFHVSFPSSTRDGCPAFGMFHAITKKTGSWCKEKSWKWKISYPLPSSGLKVSEKLWFLLVVLEQWGISM